jgi:hypothetical protein
MKPAELFNVSLKVMGIYTILAALKQTPFLIGQFLQVGWDNEAEFINAAIGMALTGGAIDIVAGCALFFSADWLTKKVYKPQESPNNGRLASD